MYPDKKCLDIIRCSSDVSNAAKVFLTYRGVILGSLALVALLSLLALIALLVSPIGVSYWQTRTSKTPSPTSYSGPAKQLFLQNR